MNPKSENVFNTLQSASYLGISVNEIVQARKRGELKSAEDGKFLYKKADLERWYNAKNRLFFGTDCEGTK